MQVHLDRADLLEGQKSGDGLKQACVSTGAREKIEKTQATEKWSKSENTTDNFSVYKKPEEEKGGGTIEDVMEQAGNMDAAQMKKKMVVASDATTATDCRQVEEEGFSLDNTDVQTIVTVVDKIKMQLAKAGVDISGFGDSLSVKQLEEIAGGAAQAQQLAGKIERLSDVPLTADNIRELKEAFWQAGQLHPMEDGAVRYMLEHSLEPTIANLYQAQYSAGSAVYQSVDLSAGFSEADFSNMEEQISHIIIQSGRQDTKAAMEDSKWLMQNRIALTPENLNAYQQLKELELPVEKEDCIEKLLFGMAEGRRPLDTPLLDGCFWKQQAAQTVDDLLHKVTDEGLAFVINKDEPVTLENLLHAHHTIQMGAASEQEVEEARKLVSDAIAMNVGEAVTTQGVGNAGDAGTAQGAANTGETVTAQGVANAGDAGIAQGVANTAETVTAQGVATAGEAVTAQGVATAGDAGVAQGVANTAETVTAQEATNTAGDNLSFSDGEWGGDAKAMRRQVAFITARKQLEEARITMTTQAAFEMLKNGIKIDIVPMEKLIEQLKGIEKGYYRSLLTQGGYEATQAEIDLFSQATGKIEELKGMPAYAIGAKNMEVRTISQLHQEGSQMQQSFQQANERYETMQTEVRKDLGDSIQKAFRNIDEILESIGRQATPENERAARILAYNRMEITPENITRMKALDQQVQMAFQNMTPGVVREFIGRGINPLDMDIAQLNRQARQIQSELTDAPIEKYSEYLYQLERNQSISQKERDAYIGIYRLINQVVDTDGAAVGALAQHGTELTMRNLLTEVRSMRHGRVDASIDDEFGELKSGGYKDSIISQIENGYQSGCMKQAFDALNPGRLQAVMQNEDWQELSPEQFLQQLTKAEEELPKEQKTERMQEEYSRQKLNDLEECAHYSKEVYETMERYDIPNTVLNAMALERQLMDRNDAYRRFFQLQPKKNAKTGSPDEFFSENGDGDVEVDFDAVRQELLARFSEDIKKPKELAKAMEELAECAEKCTSTMILENDVTYLDIRSLKLMNAQMSVNANMAKSECFSMPVVIDGEVTNVTLKVVRGEKEKGLVNITLQTDSLGKIAAELRAKENGISGYVVADSQRTTELLQFKSDSFIKELQIDDMPEPSIHFLTSAGLDINDFSANSGKSKEPKNEAQREVQTKTLYGMAEGFIRALKMIDKFNMEEI